MSLEYGKTENLLARDPDEPQFMLGDVFRKEEFRIPALWHVTEKIDGTNMRLIYRPAAKLIEVRGRSDRANVPGDLLEHMMGLAPLELFSRVFDDYLGEEAIENGASVTIYGEGFGAGIQKGGGYGPTKRFAAFDILYTRYTFGEDGEDGESGWTSHSWCNPATVSMLCAELGIEEVPLVGPKLTLDDIYAFVARGQSAFGPEAPFEGIVARTDPYLFTQGGSRLMFKLKCADLAAVRS